MWSAILGIVNKLLGLWVTKDQRDHKPEALRQKASNEIDKAVAEMDGDGVNRILDRELGRLSDQRSNDSSR